MHSLLLSPYISDLFKYYKVAGSDHMSGLTYRKFKDDNNGHDSPHCIDTEVIVERLIIVEGRDESKSKSHFESMNYSSRVFFSYSPPFSPYLSHFFHCTFQWSLASQVILILLNTFRRREPSIKWHVVLSQWVDVIYREQWDSCVGPDSWNVKQI